MHELFATLFWIAAGLIFYHLAGYPLLLALLVKLIRRPVRRADFRPFISVIVPAYNEGGIIKEKILSILNSSYPSDCLEVIVPEDGSTDDTAAQVRSISDKRVTLDHSDVRGGKMAAINRSIQRARADFLVFTDANAILLPDTLANLMSNFADPSIGCVCGQKSISGGSSIGKSENLYWRYESKIKSLESSLGSSPAAVGELMAVRSALFHLPGQYIINDDFQIALDTVRQGFRAIYDPSAITYEKSAAALSEEFARKTRIAAGRWQVVAAVFQMALLRPGFVLAFISHKLLRLLILPLLILTLMGSLGAVLFQPAALSASWLAKIFVLAAPWGQIALGLQVAVYLLAMVGLLLDRMGLRVKYLYFLYYFLHAQAAALIGFFRFTSGRQTVLWRKAAR